MHFRQYVVYSSAVRNLVGRMRYCTSFGHAKESVSKKKPASYIQ